jgi:hypothetical protein
VVPGVDPDRRAARRAGGRTACTCGRPGCPVPGAHPLDPGLLAATRDERMVRWWWRTRPEAPIVLATGDHVSAASVPAAAGPAALGAMDRLGVRLGPVLATPSRYVFLVAPYSLAELGELLDTSDWVPTSLRFHGEGGYVVLPPAGEHPGEPYWVRAPRVPAGGRVPWLPRIEVLVDALVRAGRSAPDGDRLRY